MKRSKKIFNRLAALFLVLALFCGTASFAFAAAYKDGTYSVNVTMTGGSGKTEVISPAALTISGGKMKATVSFDSEYYTTMTVNGVVYKNENKGGYSTWTIPVSALDKGINVSAVTEKMSTPHEIDYVLTFSSEGVSQADASSNNDKPSKEPADKPSKAPADKPSKAPADKPADSGVKDKDAKDEEPKENETELVFDNSYSASTSVTAEQLKDCEDKTMTVSTSKGSVEFDKEALAFIAQKAKDGITLRMDELTDSKEYAESGYGKVLDVTLKDGQGNELYSSETAGKAKVTLKYNDEVKNADELKVYRLTDGGREEIKAVYDEKAKNVSFETEHFSLYAIGEADKEKAVSEDEEKGGASPVMIAGIAAVIIIAAGAGFAVYRKKRGK